jgi:hypothetical protein
MHAGIDKHVTLVAGDVDDGRQAAEYDRRRMPVEAKAGPDDEYVSAALTRDHTIARVREQILGALALLRRRIT